MKIIRLYVFNLYVCMYVFYNLIGINNKMIGIGKCLVKCLFVLNLFSVC